MCSYYLYSQRDRTSSGFKMLKDRVITASIAGVILLALLHYANQTVVFCLFLAALNICLIEMNSILTGHVYLSIKKEHDKPWTAKYNMHFNVVSMIAVSFLYTVLVWTSSGEKEMIFGVCMLGLYTYFILSSGSIARTITTLAVFSIGSVYALFPWLFIWKLYAMGDGSLYLLLLLFIVWSSDTAAYFTGKRFGKIPLAPNISPKKTVEGAVGGILAAILVSYLWNIFQAGPKLPWLGLTLLALLGSIFGILGDLLESTFKRFANVKDSGFLLPGHGGLLDRLDGVLLASPVIWGGLYLLL